MDLRGYQQEAVNKVYEHLRTRDDNPCIVLPTGTGKSLVLGKIASDAVNLWHGRVLILAHVKELLEQNADKVRKLCPDLKVGVYSAGLKSRDTSESVIVAGIQSVYDKADKLGAFDLVVVDECFPAGTMIDTPRGQIPVEELYVGQPVHHALGVGKIEAISSRPTRTLMELELNNGKTIRCTPNHPFFTEVGWCAAGSLAVGTRLFSREDMSRLREGIPPKHLVRCAGTSQKMPVGTGMECEKILFSAMSMPGTAQAETEQAAQDFVEARGTDNKQEVPMLRKGDASGILQREACVANDMGKNEFLLNLLRKKSGQSNVPSWHGGESFQSLEGNRAFSATARGEWKRADNPSESTGRTFECPDRVSCSDNAASERNGCTTLLQTGCGDSVNETWFSAGRELPFGEESEGNGQEHEAMPGGIRVVGITHIELESPCTVYNLQVEGHPSYFADGILVHNCHLIAPEGEGMYRTFLKDMKLMNPNVRVIGLTATPFRLKGGAICKPENILNEVCYEAGLKEMIAQGYLSPLVSRAGHAEADLSSVHTKAGEFVQDELASAMDNEELVNASCEEIVRLTKDRNSVLIFCTSIEHCKHVAERIQYYSHQECAIVTGSTSSSERAEIIARFRGEKIPADLWGTPKPPLKFLANVGVLTTGFDAPNTDCVVLMRPTQSAGLLLQMAGRGTRLSPGTGKTNCLILDYGSNIMRHGPLDMIKVKEPGSGGHGEAPIKKCPKCSALIAAGYGKCPECGYEFPPPERSNLTEHASNEGVLSGEVRDEEYDVHGVFYEPHVKRNADENTPRTMRVDYETGIGQYKSEWVCPEHKGYARGKFEKWWRERACPDCPIPDTVDEAVSWARAGALAVPTHITVRWVTGEKFDRITKVVCGDKPEMNDELMWQLENGPLPPTPAGTEIINDDDLPF